MTQYNQAGPQRPGDELHITGLKRVQRDIEIRQGLIDGCGSTDTILPEIRGVALNSWTGRTISGDPVHIHYHVGVLTIVVDAPTPRGTRSPVAVMRWNPCRALADISAPVLPPGEKLEPRALMLHRERALIHQSQMLQWVSDHHRRFDELAALGLAGSKFRFRFIQEKVQTFSAA